MPFVITILVAFLTFPIAIQSQEMGYTDGIVAVVNDQIITVYDVATFNSALEKQLQNKYTAEQLKDEQHRTKLFNEINQFRVKAAHELINQKLIYTEFESKGYQFPTEVLEKRIDSIVASQAGGNWEKFDEMLTATGTNMDEFRKGIEKRLSINLLLNQTVDRNINISPQEVEDYYNNNLDEFGAAPEVRLQLIGIDNNGDSDYLQKIIGLAKDGTDFDKLVNDFSTHPTKESKGDLGWMSEGDIRTEFKAALDDFNVGTISRPVTLDNTIFLIHVAEVKPGSRAAIEEVYEAIKETLYKRERERRYQEYVSELRNKAYVRIYFKE